MTREVREAAARERASGALTYCMCRSRLMCVALFLALSTGVLLSRTAATSSLHPSPK